MLTKKVKLNQLRQGSTILIDGELRTVCMIDKSNQYNPYGAITFMAGSGISKISDSATFDRVSY